MRVFAWFVCLLCLMLPPVQAGAAQPALRGVALVVGESNYVRLATLANPEKDARDIDHMLDDLGFEVTRALDTSTPALRARIADFLESAKGADVALLYYAGHGIEAGGGNYIMGTDANIADPESASATLVPLDELLAQLQQTVPITIVLLDACRTNPFSGEQTLELAGAEEPLPIGDAGLIAVRGPTPAGTAAKKSPSLGVVVGFSASPGQAAMDGPPGANSPYASALLQHLGAGGYSFGDIMTLVSQEVYVDTGARQLPWTNSSLTKVLYFGREAAAPSGDDAQIIGDRRKLLLDIAAVPAESKAYVEAVAIQEDLRLTDLYSMLDIIKAGNGKAADSKQSLLDVAKRVREVLDDPILSGAPTDPELARLDALANKAIAAGAFKLAFKYRQQEAKRAAQLEKSLNKQQAGIDAQRSALDQQQAAVDASRRELAGVYARVAEAAMYNLNTAAETDAYERAAKQSDLFDKSISIRLRLRAANALADKASRTLSLHDGLLAIALYEDILKQLDRSKAASLWASVQLRMGDTMWEAANRQNDHDLDMSAVEAARAALTVFTQSGDFRQWSSAQLLLAAALRNTDRSIEALSVLEALLAAAPREKYPLDWGRAEEEYGNVLYDAGFQSNADTEKLAKAAEAFDAAAASYRRYDTGNYEYALARSGHAQALVAVRVKDERRLRASLEQERRAIKLHARKDTQWGNEANMLGSDLIAGGQMLDDPETVKEGLALLAKAEKIISEKTQKVDWARSREADGDGLSYLGNRKPRSVKSLKLAISAYADAEQAFTDMRTWEEQSQRVRIKKVKLQRLLGQKLSATDVALADIPPPAPLDVSEATIDVYPNWTAARSEGFTLVISRANLDGRPVPLSFDMLTDYSLPPKTPANLDLLRIVIDYSRFIDPASRSGSYSRCGDMAAHPDQIRLHYGQQSSLNACVLSKMSPGEAAIWQAVWADLPALVHAKAEAGNVVAARLDALFAVKAGQ